jgi:Spy/CpxP family protein refolding chaperone
MRIANTAGVLALILGLGAPVAAADAAGPGPGWQEEVNGALDELADQLRTLGQRASGILRGSEAADGKPIISIMLSHRQDLDLTSAQVQELERLRAEFQRSAIKGDADQRVAEMDLEMLLKAEPVQLGKVEAKIREIERIRADLRLGRIRAIEQAKSQLTPDQRKRLAGLLTDPWAEYPRWRMAPPPSPKPS